MPSQKPVLYACFHPNSFLDAIVLNCANKQPIWSLARGDAFKKNWVKAVLNSFNMLPIYRLSEGKLLMDKNGETFEACQNIFINNGQVLIYSEGICKNQTELITPLKKGTARLAQQAWNHGLDLNVMAVASNYDCFGKFGKNIVLNYGDIIHKEDFQNIEEEGKITRAINAKLEENMSAVIERNTRSVKFSQAWFYYLGWLINFPLYFILIAIAKAKTKGTVFFDSVVLGLLVFTLPLYWLLLAGLYHFVF